MVDAIDLVTGGHGFIGSHIVAALRSRGRRVRVLDVAEPPPGHRADEVLRGSVTDAEDVRRAVTGVERVFHAAGNPQLWDRDPSVFDSVNAGGTRTILRACRDAGVKRFVYTSTDVVGVGGRPIGDYAKSKHAAEELVLAAASAGLDAVIVCPGPPIGPGDRNLTPPTKMLRQFINDPPPVYYDCVLHLIDVRDVAEGHVVAGDRGRCGVRYPLRGEPIRFRELLGILEQVTGVRMPRRRIPYFVALAGAAASQVIDERIRGREPVATVTGVRLGRRSSRVSSTMHVEELGLARSPISEAVRDAVHWLATEGLLDPSRVPEALRRHTVTSAN